MSLPVQQTTAMPETETRPETHGTYTRTLFVRIQGSPASFDSLGGQAGSWGLTTEQATKIFARDTDVQPEHGKSLSP